MHKEVKDYKDNGNIKGLRYIFVDCLDVDPTFEKYEEDFDYCKDLSGLFEEYKEITPLLADRNSWNGSYWDTLKKDLMKNFSLKRFNHMMEVAKVIYSEKISRLNLEREQQESISAQPNIEAKIHIEKTEPTMQKEPVDLKKAQEQELQELEAERKRLELENQEIERKQREQREKIEQEQRRMAATSVQPVVGEQTPKKALGVVPIIAIIIVIVLIILLVRSL